MAKWRKLGKVFDPTIITDKPWMHEYAQAPSTLIYEDFVRVYFSCRSPRDKDGQFASRAAFVDLDRKNLFKILRIADKPILELGKKGCFDEFGTYPASAIRVKKEVWLYYAGWTRPVSVPFNTAIGFAKSTDDGVTFNKVGEGPVLSFSPNEPFVLSGPKIRKFKDIYYLFYISGQKWIIVDGRPEISHKIRMATSKDGVNWIKNNTNLIPDLWGKNESQASPDVIYANGQFHMFFCGWLPESFRHTKSRKIGYASSTNLLHWKRDDSKAGIEVSEGEAFDNQMLAYPHVFKLDGKTYMLYLGNEVGRKGFGLAELEGELN